MLSYHTNQGISCYSHIFLMINFAPILFWNIFSGVADTGLGSLQLSCYQLSMNSSGTFIIRMSNTKPNRWMRYFISFFFRRSKKNSVFLSQQYLTWLEEKRASAASREVMKARNFFNYLILPSQKDLLPIFVVCKLKKNSFRRKKIGNQPSQLPG